MNSKQELRQLIRQLVAQSQLAEAIETLLQHFETNDRVNEIIIQSGRLHELQRMHDSGRLAYVDYQRDLNLLRQSVLNFVDSIADQLIDTEPDPKQQLAEAYHLADARIKLIHSLNKATDGMTIKEIEEDTGLTQRKHFILALNELIAAHFVERYTTERGSLNRLTSAGKDFVEDLI